MKLISFSIEMRHFPKIIPTLPFTFFSDFMNFNYYMKNSYKRYKDIFLFVRKRLKQASNEKNIPLVDFIYCIRFKLSAILE